MILVLIYKKITQNHIRKAMRSVKDITRWIRFNEMKKPRKPNEKPQR